MGGRFIKVLFLFYFCCFAWDSSSQNLLLIFINGSVYIGFLSVILPTEPFCAFPAVTFVVIRTAPWSSREVTFTLPVRGSWEMKCVHFVVSCRTSTGAWVFWLLASGSLNSLANLLWKECERDLPVTYTSPPREHALIPHLTVSRPDIFCLKLPRFHACSWEIHVGNDGD